MSEKRSSKVYYSSQKESGWDIKKTEFEEKIKELKTMKSDLFKQKENLEQLKKQKIPLRKISAEELEISLRIAQEDNESLKKIIGHDREKTRGMEKELEACKTACKELDYKNRVAQLQLTEKDRVLSRYLCEMLILKQEVEKIISPSSTLSTSITNSLNLLYSVENQKKFISIEEKTEEKSIEIPRSSKFYESEIARLQKQLFETQDLYKLTSQQLKEIIEKNNRQDSEFLKVRGKLQDTRNEFSQISSQVIRNSNDRDFQAKALIVELEELRKKRDQQESEIVKIEQRYKSSLSELELDLEKSRRKILELIEAKTKLESEVGGGKSEKKEIYGQLQFKDLKISELSATLQNTTHELNLLKKIVKAKPNECMYDSKGKYEGKWMEVAQENEELRERIEIYESERVRQQAELQNTSKTIVKQLSNIILSRDHQGPVEDMTRNLSRILVENRPIFEGILRDHFGDNYLRLREAMQDKIDESIQIIEELSKHNKSLTSQLAQESNKRKKIAQELQQIESEVSEKQSDPQRKSEKKISSATENLRKNLSDTEDGVFLNKTHEGLKNSTQHETEISEFDDIFKKLKGNDLKVNGIDMLYFLQCEAAALEDFLEAVEE